MNRFQTYRWTLVVSVLALLAWAIPSLGLWLELDYALVAEGQWWRIWTGHLTHYDGNHLFFDLLMFAVLGAACERANPRGYPLALIAMMAGVSFAIAWFCDGINVYRGLSGVDTGLFVWLVADQCHQCWREGRFRFAAIWMFAVSGLLGKLVFEAATGQTLFVDSSDFTPLVESHLAGAGIGVLAHVVAVIGNGMIGIGTTGEVFRAEPQRRKGRYNLLRLGGFSRDLSLSRSFGGASNDDRLSRHWERCLQEASSPDRCPPRHVDDR